MKGLIVFLAAVAAVAILASRCLAEPPCDKGGRIGICAIGGSSPEGAPHRHYHRHGAFERASMRRLATIVAGLVLFLVAPAMAQTPGGSVCPYIAYGAVPTPAQWNYCFQIKQDYIGYTPLNKAGDTMLGELITTASVAANAGFNIQPGSAPTAPNSGDIWVTSSGMFAHIGGATIQLTGAGSGSFTASNPLAVTFPTAGVVNYALNYNSTLNLDGSNNLEVNLGKANTWTAAQTFPNNSLTLAEFPTIGANTVLGAIAAGTPAALSQAQLTSLINPFTTSLNGAVPAPGSVSGRFLGDDGAWHTVSGSGTVTQVGIAAGTFNVNPTGTCTITTSGTCTLYTYPSGYVNKLRNASLTAWFHGCVSTACTITTSGGWCAEGVYVRPTGASVSCQEETGVNCPTGSLTANCVKITSAASVTAIQVRFVVESLDAAPLAGLQTTFQMRWLNSCGASVTPTLQADYPTAQDNYGSVGTDLASANLQATANGASQVDAYSWQTSSSISNGDSIDIGFGACGASSGDSFTIAGGFDWRATPGFSTGAVSSPPGPEIRTVADDIAWNERFYETSYDNGTAPGTATHTGMQGGFDAYASGTAAAQSGVITFKAAKRVDPSMSLWDGAGTANKSSERNAAVWADGSCTVASAVASMTGDVVDQTNCGSGQAGANLFFQYAADATITGG